jgi:dTDP-4-amino-4,6-dideoxygalactose transaminase
MNSAQPVRATALLHPIQLLNPSTLPITDRIMRDTFWLGVYPGMTEEMINYVIDKVREFGRAESSKGKGKKMKACRQGGEKL